ncbi:MAG: HEAT repeat domain-containing protein [Planctomycetes bacterium]|nr:HEAT repeat domain-containing protein [Planctomycetota bacterium]
MKASSLLLICVACAIGAGGAAVLLFETLHQPAQTAIAQPTPAPVRDPNHDKEIAELRGQIADLRAEVSQLKAQQKAAPQPTPAEPPPEDAATEEEPAGETADDPALKKSLEDIDTGQADIKAIREQAIADIASKNEGKRDAALELLIALAQRGDTDANAALLNAMKSEDADLRQELIDKLGESENAEFLPVLEGAMADPDANVRAEVAGALGKMPADLAGPLLLKLLADTEIDVLRKAADSLGDLKYQPALAELQRLSRHTDEGVAVEAAVSMARLGDTSAAEGWVSTIGARLTSNDVRERRNAVKTLRRFKLESTRPYLEQALNDEDSNVRSEAQKGLKALK